MIRWVCPWCNKLVRMVCVAGHLQCPLCQQVTETCCEGTPS